MGKFVDIIDINEWEVESDQGWVDISAIGKTIEYVVWQIITETGLQIRCADDHILFDNKLNEIYAKNLTAGDFILTINGPEEIMYIHKLSNKENMYDLQINSNEHRYFTNGILSHNSIFLGNLATEASRLGYNAAFITLEMGDTDVMARIGANILDVPIDEYKEFAKKPNKVKKRIDKYRKGDNSTLITPGYLFIKEYPTSSAGVPEFEAYLKKVEEIQGFKFSVVVIDYINICMNWRNPNTENTYMKIKQLAEDFRAMGQRNDWSIATASQVNRDGVANSDLSTKSTSESMGLVHSLDGLFGIVQDEEQRANGIYIVKALKLRNSGEVNSKKRFLIDYSHMRITEDNEHASYNMDSRNNEE